ncbi:MAG: helix-turn-helix transcriptional regulator [Bacteroidales bacterium]
MDIRLKIGNRIKKIREAKGISQKDLAYESDLDRSYIASIEVGKRNVSIINLEKIASALKITLSQLFEDLDHETENQKQ